MYRGEWRVIWTQWYFGFWWWRRPDGRDWAFGVNFGPISGYWQKGGRDG